MNLYPEVVSLVVKKYAFYKDDDIKEDLTQACYLAILEAGKRVTSPAIAYLIARDTIVRILHRDNDEEGLSIRSLSEPDIFRKAENRNYTIPDYEKLDGFPGLRKARRSLTATENLVLHMRYVESFKYKYIGAMFGKTAEWARQKEKAALKKLKKELE